MSTRLIRLVVVIFLTLPALLLATPASACACGGIASSDPDARVNGEIAIVSKSGNRETIDMRLSMRSIAHDAALVIPTPTSAAVSAGDSSTFDRYATITAPRVETREHWWVSSTNTPDGGVGAPAPGTAPTGAPTVVQQVALGPLEATVLTGGDLPGLRKWLSDNGYRLKTAVGDALSPYVDEHWSFVAIRLNSDTPLSGPLDPIRMVFDSDRIVYPMRMSVAAKGFQRVITYVVADHRQERVDGDANSQNIEVSYAGRLDDGRFLTQVTTIIARPSTITSDFVFADADNDDPFQEVRYVDSDVRILGIMAGPFLVGIGVLAIAAVAAIIARRRG
ncbi:DUF2330 domain-containing protein [Gordonia sp. CPCC 205333]|uniref:DUF2330 domain-containing protein n=1 Tax=Gordonia sp. CPCC 205333 TaxID=3140790 RepID=UPI003AF39E61